MARRTHIPGSPRRREGAAALPGWGGCGRGFAGASPPSPAGQRRHLALRRGCCSAFACSRAPLPPFSPPLAFPSFPPPLLSFSLSPPCTGGLFFFSLPPRSRFPKGPAKMLSWKLQLLTPSARPGEAPPSRGVVSGRTGRTPLGCRGRAQPAGGLRASLALPSAQRLKCAGSWIAVTSEPFKISSNFLHVLNTVRSRVAPECKPISI